MAIWMHANGLVEEVEPKNGRDFKLKELRGFVGGSIELVRLGDRVPLIMYVGQGQSLRMPRPALMVVNDEGKLRQLPTNQNATALWAFAYGPSDIIVGDALVCDVDQIT